MLAPWRVLIFFVSAIICSVFAQDENNYRLPTTISPSHYSIELTPYFQNETVGNKVEFTFDGVARITFRATTFNVNTIVLHSNKLNILSTTLEQGLQNVQIVSSVYTELTHKITITLPAALTQNVDYVITFNFIGILDTDMYGFYRSNYVENDIVKWLGTTQMQPTHARRVFPCFDEPSFKATFDVIINRPAHFQPSISNTVLLNSTLQNGRYREVFERTPRMSTYLLAFIVSEFSTRETIDKSFAVVSRPDALNQTQYAFDVGQSLLQKLDEWTQYPYSSVPEMKKMHMAALPDFSAGAMENWGLLTYRETALLYAPATSTFLAQQRVASVIAHEQAHMWFGDLVTCDWWSYTWLNEGFARYFQYFGTAMVETTWDLDLQFVVEQLQVVFGMDSLESTHPMSHDVNTPAEVSAIFDNISYNKGAAVLRMIEHIMGSSNFQAAIRAYLVANAYGTSTPEKLFTSLQVQTTRVNVTEFLNPWTTQSGYPVVTVERHADRRTVTVHQERFLLKNLNHTDQTKWEIHLNYASPSNNKFTDTNTVQILARENASITFQLDQETDWAVFNVLQTGYYRVNYDAETWENLANALKATNHSGIHVLNRAQIVDDALNLARAGYLNYTIALNILQYLEKEENYIPWLAALNNLAYVTRRFNAEVTEEYKKFFINLSKGVYEKLGFVEKPTDSRIDIYNRLNILNYNCKYGHAECIQTARVEFAKIQNETSPVPVNLRPAVYCSAVTNGNYIEYHLLFLKYLDENVAAEQLVLLNAMGCTKFESTLTEFMTFILSDDVRLQDKAAAFTATFNERIENVPFVLDFVIENHTNITTAIGSLNSVQTILSNLAARFSTQEQITKLQTFYNTNRALFGTSQTIPNAIDDANFNLLWAEKNVPEIYEFLKLANSASRGAINALLIGVISMFIVVKKFIFYL